MAATFEHKELGELEGVVSDETLQFRGLQYATLENRFAAPQVKTSYASSTDATKFGPPPVSLPIAIHNEFGFIQKSLPLPDVPNHSDTEGLNLNITIPTKDSAPISSPKSKLPVYVFIHGGGFAFGSSWYPHYNASSLVKLSTEMGKPVIGITINYRLGATGFLTSKEMRDAGFKANNGLHDQRAALEWVRRFIGGFGGDPNEITVIGESAGGLSSTLLLCSKKPLMKRCISTGGAILLFKPLPPSATETAYTSVIEAFGLSDKSPEERIKALLSIPMDDLWQKVPMTAQLSPAIDGDLVPGVPSFDLISSKDDDKEFPMPGRKWCEALMVGDSKLDASILIYLGLDARKSGIASQFISSAKKTLSAHPKAAEYLLSSYNLSDSTDDDEALLTILRFASEISFYAPGQAFAKGWPNTPSNKFFLYHFNEGNPWEGRFKGEAGHILDVAFLFQNYNEHMSEEQKAVARKYGEDFVNFFNGEDPWPVVQDGKMSARVYGPSNDGVSAKYVDSGIPEEAGRKRRVLLLGEMAGLDLISEVFQNFIQGK